MSKNFKRIKKIMKAHFIQTVIIYTFIYLSYSFINWDIINPFEWVLNLPRMNPAVRTVLFIIFVVYNSFGLGMRFELTD